MRSSEVYAVVREHVRFKRQNSIDSKNIRCRQTGQNQPFGFRFLLGCVGAGMGATGVTVGGCGVAGAGAAPSAVVFVAGSAASAAGASDAAGVASAASAGAGAAGAAAASASASVSTCGKVPPAPYSTMFTAHSRQATRWRQGRRTTSRGDERQSRHSDGASDESAATDGIGISAA